MTVTAIRRVDRTEALEQLRLDPELAKTSIVLLAKRWGVARSTARNWMRHAHSQANPPASASAASLVLPISAAAPPPTAPAVALLSAIPDGAPTLSAIPDKAHVWSATNATAYATAAMLATVAAYFSVGGMTEIFPGAPAAVVALAAAMEAAKLVTAGWLARHWRVTGTLLRIVLIALVSGLAVVNAAGVYGRLVEAHVGVTVAASSSIDERIGAIEARIAAQTSVVAGLDGRLQEIDGAIHKLTETGRANAALSAIAAQRKTREALLADRTREAALLTAMRSERAKLGADHQRTEAASGPIVYLAAMAGMPVEQAIRWLILLMVLTCDPTAIALTVAASRRAALR